MTPRYGGKTRQEWLDIHEQRAWKARNEGPPKSRKTRLRE
jgi:hypothetical protein